MNIEVLKKTNPERIKDYAYEEIKYIEELTGKPVDIRIVPNIKSGADALTKIARKHMSHTIMYVKETALIYINHLILHECGHIRRIFSVNPEHRFNMSVIEINNDVAISKKVINHIAKLGIPQHDQQRLCDMYINGVMLQVVNIIPDIRIENDIYNRVEENRDEQKAYLNYLGKTLEAVTANKVSMYTPTPILEISLALNYLLLDNIKAIIGTRILNIYKQTPIAKKGYKKIKTVFAKDDDGYIQDIELTNTILDIFNINYVQWSEFDRVGIGYELDY